jgi:ethylbenzene dioxygenase beta subunit
MQATLDTRESLYCSVLAFLAQEAELLDDNRLRDWLALLDRAITYRMPIRVTRERTAGAGFSTAGWHMKEDWDSIQTRIERFETSFAWAEDPPSRVRRFVTNVRVAPTEDADVVAVKSNILVYKARYDSPAAALMSAERRDLLTDADGWRIREREVLLDHTTLGVSNISIFL